MANVITKRAVVQCSHLGTVTLVPSQSKLRIGGSPVLVKGDLDKKSIPNCPVTDDPQTSTKKCLAVGSASGGVAAKLKIGGQGVLLETVNGKTDGTSGGLLQSWKVISAGQSRLKAV